MGLNKNERKTFANIIGDGSIRVQTNENNPDAQKRVYKTSGGDEGVKFELVYDNLSGNIENIEIIETQYGDNLHITIDGITLSAGLSTNFATDMMQKLPNIDLSKSAKFTPYSFTDDKKKLRKGVSIEQNEMKIKNFFYDEKTKKNINGFPDFPKDYKKFTKNQWKAHFGGIEDFLKKYTIENIDLDKCLVKTEDNIDADIDNIPFK